MDEKRLVETGRNGRAEHHHVGQTEVTGVVSAFQGAFHMLETLGALKHTALVATEVLEDKLVAPVFDKVDDDMAIATLKIADAVAAALLNRLQVVVNNQVVEIFRIGGLLVYEKRLGRTDEGIVVHLGVKECNLDIMLCYAQVDGLWIHF